MLLREDSASSASRADAPIPTVPTDKYLPHAHHTHTHADVPVPAVLSGCAMCLVAGMPYAFGAYAATLKAELGMRQGGMASLGVALDFGLYLAMPLSGTFFDTFGTPATALLAALLVVCGNGSIAAMLAHVEGGGQAPPFGVVALAFLCAGMGGGFTNMTAVGTNVKRTPLHHRALVIATHSACFGISALVVVSTLGALSADGTRLSRFFGAWALITGLVGCLGGAVLSSRLGGDPHPGHLIEDFHLELAVDDQLRARASSAHAAVMSLSLDAGLDTLLARLDGGADAPAAADAAAAAPPRLSLGAPARGARLSLGSALPGGGGGGAGRGDAQLAHAAAPASDLRLVEAEVPVAVAIAHEASSLRLLARVCVHADFWLLEASLFCAFGAGLFVVNNVGPCVASAGGSAAQGALATAIFPVGNALGRGSFALLSGLPCWPLPRMRRGHWLVAGLALSSLAYAAAALAYDAGRVHVVYALVALISPAYGLAWVVAQSVLAESYPLENFGTMLGLVSLTAGAAGFAFNEAGAALYERALGVLHAEAHGMVEEEPAPGGGGGGGGGEDDCVGASCFRTAFWLMCAAAAAGALAASAFAPYTQSPAMLEAEDKADEAILASLDVSRQHSRSTRTSRSNLPGTPARGGDASDSGVGVARRGAGVPPGSAPTAATK